MKGSTHLAGGLLAGIFALNGSPISIMPLVASGIAALAPDWIQINLPGANRVIRGISGHRGFSHWLLSALGGALIADRMFGLGAFVLAGWLSHIILDMLSGGVKAAFPLQTHLVLCNIKTGSKMDATVGAACLVIASILLLATWRFL